MKLWLVIACWLQYLLQNLLYRIYCVVRLEDKEIRPHMSQNHLLEQNHYRLFKTDYSVVDQGGGTYLDPIQNWFTETDDVEEKRFWPSYQSWTPQIFTRFRFKNVNAKVDTHRNPSAGRRSHVGLYEPSKSDAPKRTEIAACRWTFEPRI